MKKITPRRWLTEYRAGFKSGEKHNPNNLGCVENLQKGLESDEPLIQAYWKGYRAGANYVPTSGK